MQIKGGICMLIENEKHYWRSACSVNYFLFLTLLIIVYKLPSVKLIDSILEFDITERLLS